MLFSVNDTTAVLGLVTHQDGTTCQMENIFVMLALITCTAGESATLCSCTASNCSWMVLIEFCSKCFTPSAAFFKASQVVFPVHLILYIIIKQAANVLQQKYCI